MYCSAMLSLKIEKNDLLPHQVGFEPAIVRQNYCLRNLSTPPSRLALASGAINPSNDPNVR